MKKVLVVDDDLDILFVVKILLERHGFLVEPLSRCNLLDKKIEQFEPGLILLDVNLKFCDGRVLCKELKQKEETKNIPVILFSSDHSIISQYKDFFADAFMEKPFEAHDLVKKTSLFFTSNN